MRERITKYEVIKKQEGLIEDNVIELDVDLMYKNEPTQAVE